MAHVPFIRFSRTRNPDYEARRLKRRFASISRAYERAMQRRQRMSRARQIALAVLAFIGAFAVGWMLLDRSWPT
jgi:hypothetical protein